MEIEHKYLVKGDAYKQDACEKSEIMQGFLSRDPQRTVRVRMRDGKGFITIKGKGEGAAHPEFEYEVPAEDEPEAEATPPRSDVRGDELELVWPVATIERRLPSDEDDEPPDISDGNIEDASAVWATVPRVAKFLMHST